MKNMAQTMPMPDSVKQFCLQQSVGAERWLQKSGDRVCVTFRPVLTLPIRVLVLCLPWGSRKHSRAACETTTPCCRMSFTFCSDVPAQSRYPSKRQHAHTHTRACTQGDAVTHRNVMLSFGQLKHRLQHIKDDLQGDSDGRAEQEPAIVAHRTQSSQGSNATHLSTALAQFVALPPKEVSSGFSVTFESEEGVGDGPCK